MLNSTHSISRRPIIFSLCALCALCALCSLWLELRFLGLLRLLLFFVMPIAGHRLINELR